MNQGTLQLNKTGGARSIRGTLHVGDNRGGAGADVVRYGPLAGTDNIDNVAVVIHSSGLLDLNDVSDTVNNTLTLTVGPESSGQLRTGGGAYTMNNAVNVVVLGGTAAAPAVISGNPEPWWQRAQFRGPQLGRHLPRTRHPGHCHQRRHYQAQRRRPPALQRRQQLRRHHLRRSQAS